MNTLFLTQLTMGGQRKVAMALFGHSIGGQSEFLNDLQGSSELEMAFSRSLETA
jgi:hypothetical protein